MRPGERAAVLVEDDTLLEARANAQERIKDLWCRSVSDKEREALWHQYQALDVLFRELRILADDHKVELDQRDKR